MFRKFVKVFCYSFSIMLCMTTCNIFALPRDYTGVELAGENPAFTQEDIDSNFIDYAEINATKNLSANKTSIDNTANVVGVVLDFETGQPVSEATIIANDAFIVKTGSDGRFQIINMPNGDYDWQVKAAGYENGKYMNYTVDGSDGATIFTFYIETGRETIVDSEDFYKQEQSEPPENSLNDDGTYTNDTIMRAMSSTPVLESTIAVRYNGSTISVNRQQYLYTVLSSELYAKSWYTEKGLSGSQVDQLYIAQAIAANSFLEYSLSVYSNHSGATYDVCSTTCCQVYNPTKVTQAAISAVSVIYERIGDQWFCSLILYKPTSNTYDYIWGAFFSSCGNNGTLTRVGQPALQAKPCTDIVSGAGGHRYGLCQMGAAQLAKNGYSYVSIINYYYKGCGIPSCRVL